MQHRNRELLAASIGNALEWFDFGLYGYLALTMQQLFFPFESATKGLLSVFLIFAVGLLMRPLGGLIFGTIGDKRGRRSALIISISTMAASTLFMGLLPTYKQAGNTAVVLLIAARLIQGLAVGGEMIGSMVFLVEHAHPSKRGFAGSLIYSVGTLGGLLGSLSAASLFLLFSQEAIENWAWRLPFFLGLMAAAFAFYIRLKLHETPLFLKLQEAHQTASHPFKEAMHGFYKEIAVIFSLVSLQAVGYYILFVYLPTWLKKEAAFKQADAFLLNSIGLGILILCIPLCAALSDHIGRKKILLSGALLTLLAAFPFFKFLSEASTLYSPFAGSVVAVSLFSMIVALYQGPLAATMAELLTTKNRYMSLVIGYNSSAALFGGSAPYLSTALIAWTGNILAPSVLLITVSAVAILVLLFSVKETYKRSL